jgi:hydroxymethylpyrimidine pyrophosphatase-like HAD family hydrolase
MLAASTPSSASEPRDCAQPLTVANLLHDLDGLRELLQVQLDASAWSDAFLLAAGMHQVVEDWLHRQLPALGTCATKLAYLPGRAGRWGARGAREVSQVGLQIRARTPHERPVITWQSHFGHLVQVLADYIAAESLGEQPVQLERERALQFMGRRLLAQVAGLPADVRRSILRLPTAFRSLDLHPLDCCELVARFAAREPDRRRPLLVIGVRTSGSYLAPLYAAFLRRQGYERVDSLTLRPRQALLEPEVRRFRALVRDDGLLLLADDPPNSGLALVSVAAALGRFGLETRQIVPLVTLLGPLESLPEELERYRPIVLAGEEWHIQSRLEPTLIQQDLRRLLCGKSITVTTGPGSASRMTVVDVRAVHRLPLAPVRDLHAGSPLRRHVRALYRATLLDAEQPRSVHHDVYVKGVGLGYLGAHSLAVGEPLADFLPEQYGLVDGLLFRQWLPEENRVHATLDPEPRLADRMAEYIVTRQRALAVSEDLSVRLIGEDAAWERVAGLFRAAFRNVKPTLIDGCVADAARALLEVSTPSVIDGSMSPSQWFSTSRNATRRLSLLKVDYDERSFSNQDTVTDQLYCYDAAFDASAASAAFELEAAGDGRAFWNEMRTAYARHVGQDIDAERSFLYEWLHIDSYLQFVQEELFPGVFSRRRSQQVGADALDAASLAKQLELGRRAQARFSQRYFEQRVFHDLQPAASGPLCGIDLDGVLETLWLGFLAITPLGARALRALTCHGYRPVLVTGRSLGDVQERCQAYRLAGGVAEYGSAIYNPYTGRSECLLTHNQRADLQSLRAALELTSGVHIDPAYSLAVRAYHFVAPAKRRALPPEVVKAALANAGVAGRVQAVAGVRQTDFVPVGVDKWTGLQALARELGTSTQLAMSIGDTASDLPMLMRSAAAFAPANADAEVASAGVSIMRHPHERGLAEAVARFLRHHPVRCTTCAMPPLPARAAMLLTILDAQDRGPLGSLSRAARVHQLVHKSAPRPVEPLVSSPDD